MSDHILEVNIPEPCSESWEKMTPATGGRHCAVCDKVVHDMRGKSGKAIFDFLNKHHNPCALFDQQVKAPEETVAEQVQPQFAYKQWTFMRKFAFALMLAFGTLLFTTNASALPYLEEVRQTASQSLMTKRTIKKSISGIVTDATTGEALPGVNIVVMKDSTFVTGTSTDFDGKYHLELDAKQWAALESGTLHIKMLGYQNQEMEGQQFAGQVHQVLNLSMLAREIEIRGVMIVAPPVPIRTLGRIGGAVGEMRIVRSEIPEDTDRGVRIELRSDDDF